MRSLFLIAACLGLSIATGDARAAGGGGGGGGGDGGDEPARVVNDADYNAAMKAVKASDWSQVVVRMNAYVVRNPNDADAWNELAHAYRKAGDLDSAFKNYDKALKRSTRGIRNAHEYLPVREPYLQAGDLVRAEAELHVLDRLCFLPCEQYTDLKQEIARYKTEHPPVAATR